MNTGKKFETAIKNSIPHYCFYYKLPDPPQAFDKISKLRFSWKNPCDLFLFNSKILQLFALELKTTKTNFTFEDINVEGTQPIRMIHSHQILSLINFKRYNMKCGFIFNFRNEIKQIETSYFQDIDNFIIMVNEINKKSFNELDLLKYKPINIIGQKKRINYTWDLDGFFHEMEK